MVKMVKPPAKVQIPQGEEMEEEEEETSEGGADGQGQMGSYTSTVFNGLSVLFLLVLSPPPPLVAKKPMKQGETKAAKETEAEPTEENRPAQGRGPAVSSADPAPPRSEPSREIRNIIRMYQSRPGPVPVPVQPIRWAPGEGSQGLSSPGDHRVDLVTSSLSHKASQKFSEEK